ncbi:ATPase family associated with various cellular activities (AAA) [Pirellulimonas nuda]|uniref:ATPase family associated with various cellular activities (AAA) n=1 Tax=Pirellulimonas nuda TaxID=2528009 RepID=A0A518DB70_9BACT|nr:MoxR family ATPase [Pirellulimonas nuda]QDU88731.1 ATPase family associated with various cellular activities (AAA) [Pirellulimonas nuda]
MNDAPPPSNEAIERISAASSQIKTQLGRVVVGQEEVIDLLLVALFCRGHCLLEGVPGLAKTLLVSTLAKSLNLSFSRIQFTPDLMPGDVTGADVLEENKATGQREVRFMPGPIFAHVLLADEINRTPPKTQAALLEAMQERQVTVGQTRRLIEHPFVVLATQNPIEQEGTYPLPEAQQDRFMFKAIVRYPSFDDEVEVARRTTSRAMEEVDSVLSPAEIVELQDLVLTTPISDHLTRYVVALVRGTRVGEPEATDVARRRLEWGAGTRAVQHLILGAKARALMSGRPCVTLEDVQALVKPVLRHRLVLNFSAESEGISADDVLEDLIKATPAREGALNHDARFRGLAAS